MLVAAVATVCERRDDCVQAASECGVSAVWRPRSAATLACRSSISMPDTLLRQISHRLRLVAEQTMTTKIAS